MTNETKEQFESLKKIYGIIDDSKITNFKFFNDLKQLRRSKRIHFTMDTNFLKLSTIHSYKGWESKTVILVLTPSKDDNLSEDSLVHIKEEFLIYTAITRAKEKLFILNLGNTKYHSFFEKYSY
jgi:superfamily I DNA/RNA helicase